MGTHKGRGSFIAVVVGTALAVAACSSGSSSNTATGPTTTTTSTGATTTSASSASTGASTTTAAPASGCVVNGTIGSEQVHDQAVDKDAKGDYSATISAAPQTIVSLGPQFSLIEVGSDQWFGPTTSSSATGLTLSGAIQSETGKSDLAVDLTVTC